MSLELSPAMRRFSAVGLLFVVLALAWSVIVVPLLDARSEARDTIERLQPIVERGRAAVGDIAGLRTELRRLKEGRHSAGGLLSGTNEPIAAAQLQERLKTAVDRAGGKLRSTQVLPARDDGAFRRVTIRAQLSIDLPGLQRVVYELEASLPYLFLDNIEIAQRPGNRGSPAGGDPLLDVGFGLSGYIRKAT